MTKFIENVCRLCYQDVLLGEDLTFSLIKYSNIIASEIKKSSNINEEFLEEYKTKTHDTNKLKTYIKEEIQNIYKNLQTEGKFICHSSACNVCKFMAHNNITNKELLKNDYCDSYFVNEEDLFNTENLITGNIHIYNVPIKYKRELASFYKVIMLKFKHIFKTKVRICFNNSEEYLFKKIDDKYMIKFDNKTYKEFLLRALLNIDINESIREHYYSKINEQVIFPNNKFITYLASLNEEQFFIENVIAYILRPKELSELDYVLFNLIERCVKHEYNYQNIS